jgi:hypothetical protein
MAPNRIPDRAIAFSRPLHKGAAYSAKLANNTWRDFFSAT